MRVLLADAQALVREGLKSVSLQLDDSCEFVEAADASSAHDVMSSTSAIDVAWFDETFLGNDDLAALRIRRPQLLLLALCVPDTGASMHRLDASINALVPRSAPVDVLRAAMRLAMAGNVCVRCSLPPAASAALSGGARRGIGPLNLTSRQYEVLRLVAQSRSNKAIAAELGIGVRTVKGHVSVILRALHADNRTDAGRSARRWLARSAPVDRTLARPP